MDREPNLKRSVEHRSRFVGKHTYTPGKHATARHRPQWKAVSVPQPPPADQRRHPPAGGNADQWKPQPTTDPQGSQNQTKEKKNINHSAHNTRQKPTTLNAKRFQIEPSKVCHFHFVSLLLFFRACWLSIIHYNFMRVVECRYRRQRIRRTESTCRRP